MSERSCWLPTPPSLTPPRIWLSPEPGSSAWPPGAAGPTIYPPSFANFIINWEAEHYRASLTGNAQAPLAGHVALVTGAASGLGCGIALGLVEAGAAVAFCDIDEPGVETAAASSADPRRALAVRMDVTSEQSVTAAFDRACEPLGRHRYRGLRGRHRPSVRTRRYARG